MAKQDLSLLLTILTGIIIPFVVNRYTSIRWSGEAKFGIIIGLSMIGGFLNYATTEEIAGKSWIQIVGNSALMAIAFYQVAFKALGLEKVVSPRNALVNKSKKVIQEKVAGLQDSTVKAINDKNNDTTLEVEATVRQ